ncbi:MAG: aldo/keto reductase [Planctomycetales bacterium]
MPPLAPTIELGRTGLRVSRVAFGAGPVSNLMTPGAAEDLQRRTVLRAIDCGINWFDTAATYGDGASETALGNIFRDLSPAVPIHIATKARIPPEETHRIRDYILESVSASLQRLQRSSVTLLQLHNSITEHRGDEPTSLTLADVLEKGGVLEAFDQLRRAGIVRHLGLTGIGTPAVLKLVIDSGQFDTIQSPCHLLNPSGIRPIPHPFPDKDYEQLLAHAHSQGLGTFAIRVLAGGALAGHPPSAHTLKTKFFPLDLYEQDRARAARVTASLPAGMTLSQAAIQYILSSQSIDSAIIGFATPEQVEEVVGWASAPSLSPDELTRLEHLALAP